MMALEKLCSKIELLKSRIRSHRTILEVNETRTRVALIDPLLNELGWDVSDPVRVTTEYSVGKGGVADYALFDNQGQLIAILEAKRLGTTLSAHQMQIVNYAVASGIRYAGLTNGDNWEVYDVFQQVELDKKRILDTSISTAPVHESVLKFLLLWHPNLASGLPVSPTLPPLPEPPERDWIQLVEYNPPPHTRPPSAIKFWDGTYQNVTKWFEVLTLVVEKLYAERLIDNKNIPIESSPGTYLVNSEPVHRNGKSFYNYKQIGELSLYVNTNLNAGQVRTNVKKLLERYSSNSTNVYVQLN